MTLSQAIFTFFNAWFISLFFVTPFFARPPEKPAASDYAAAPETPRWRKVARASAMVAALVTFLLWLVIASGLIGLRPEN